MTKCEMQDVAEADFIANRTNDRLYLGMSMTTAFSIFAKAVVREQRIPFELKVDIPML